MRSASPRACASCPPSCPSCASSTSWRSATASPSRCGPRVPASPSPQWGRAPLRLLRFRSPRLRRSRHRCLLLRPSQRRRPRRSPLRPRALRLLRFPRSPRPCLLRLPPPCARGLGLVRLRVPTPGRLLRHSLRRLPSRTSLRVCGPPPRPRRPPRSPRRRCRERPPRPEQLLRQEQPLLQEHLPHRARQLLPLGEPLLRSPR